MTSVPFSGGAIDLSALKPAPPAPTGARWWVEADDRSVETMLALSMQHAVVVEFWSPRAPSAAQLSADLKDLADEAQGAWLLVRINVDESPAAAQAFQVTAVPTVFGVVGGQLAPLFQGTTDKAQAKAVIGQLVMLAQQNGLTGRAKPVLPDDAGDPTVPDPRFEAADAALARGDHAAAEAEFAKLLEANPADTEAKAGIAQTRLLARLGEAGDDASGLVARADADAGDVAANLVAADLQVASGDLAGGFARLVELVRRTSGAQRESVRQRLLELFEAVGQTQPEVLSARRDLMTALF